MSPASSSAAPASLTHHYLRYLNANLLSVVAGFISWPVMTRLLDKKEFGIFSYFETLALIWIAILKLGTQHSIVRFYPSHCAGKEAGERKRFYVAFILAPAVFSILLGGLATFGVWLWNSRWPIAEVRFLYVVLALGQIGALSSLFENTIRARELSGLASIVMVVGRWLQVLLVIVILFKISATAMGVYAARIVASAVVLGWLIYWGARRCEFDPRAYDSKLFRENLVYGLPLVVGEISLILLAFADQLMLRHMLGSFEPVGVYKIGYGLAMYLGIFMRTSLYQAFAPVANRLYESRGAAPVQDLKRRLVKLLLYIGAALTAGLFCVGRDFLILVSGADKADSVPVFQWVGLNYVLTPILSVAAYGLVLMKRTQVTSVTVLICCMVNIVLNLFFIPRWGVMGSVWATLASYILMGILQMALCPAELRTVPRLWDLLRPAFLAGLLTGVAIGTNLLGTRGEVARLAVMSALFIVLFCLPALWIDPELRSMVKEKFGMWRTRRRS